MALWTGTSPRKRASAFTRKTGVWPFSASRYSKPYASQLRSMTGARCARVPKILVTPHPSDHCDRMMPAAPAASRASGKTRRSTPVFSSRARHASIACSRSSVMRTSVSGRANHSRLSRGRQLSSGREISTNLPLTSGSHASKAWGFPASARITTPASTGPSVAGLHAAAMPSSVLTRGEIRSMWLMPRSHPRHEPYCSL